MSSYRVAAAGPAELEAVHRLLSAAGDGLVTRGYHNWENRYPKANLAADLAEGVVFVVNQVEAAGAPLGETLVATYMLRRSPAHRYVPAPWADPDAAARYLNRLAVEPRLQGRGVGRWCLTYLESVATADGVRAIRCDVLAANAELRRFYERAGYEVRGRRAHSGWEFACYERLLPGAAPLGGPSDNAR